jgi:hypothetical protein
MTTTAGYLNAGTLATLQAFDEAQMRDVCDIHRAVPGTPNPDNSPGNDTVAIQSDIPCRFFRVAARIRGVEGIYALGASGEYASVLRLPLGTDVTPDDVVVYRGDQYEIIGTNEGRTFATSIALALRLLT